METTTRRQREVCDITCTCFVLCSLRLQNEASITYYVYAQGNESCFLVCPTYLESYYAEYRHIPFTPDADHRACHIFFTSKPRLLPASTAFMSRSPSIHRPSSATRLPTTILQTRRGIT
eukprot:6214500-Pleurochrysis_carterae.AAC.1